MNTTLEGIMIALINPAALPALRIAGGLFLIINLLGGAYIFRHWRRLFAPDPQVDGDTETTSHIRMELILIPWLALTALLVVEGLRLWIK
jgi:disulfide bond formation protein DsbB